MGPRRLPQAAAIAISARDLLGGERKPEEKCIEVRIAAVLLPTDRGLRLWGPFLQWGPFFLKHRRVCACLTRFVVVH